MLYYARLERLAKDKHSSLLSPFVSYEDHEVLRVRVDCENLVKIHKTLAFHPDQVLPSSGMSADFAFQLKRGKKLKNSFFLSLQKGVKLTNQ